MIALDANVLVRLLVRDDERQAASARELFDANAGNDEALFVGDVVLAELAWVLRGRYAVDAGGIALAIRGLLGNATLAWRSRTVVEQALALYEGGEADFADCLVVAQAAQRGCEATATFDPGMRSLPGVRVM